MQLENIFIPSITEFYNMDPRKRKIYSYVIPTDDGSAPNPYWGICTLAICKPAIRRTARPGDWVIGTGSKRSPLGDISKKLVYAMQVEQVVTMKTYDLISRVIDSRKIPCFETEQNSLDLFQILGDCIYDFSGSRSNPRQRKGVHIRDNKNKDLRGENVLTSSNFYYFGDRPIDIPSISLPTNPSKNLQDIIKNNEGHRKIEDEETIELFENWLASLNLSPGLYGNPQMLLKVYRNLMSRGLIKKRNSIRMI